MWCLPHRACGKRTINKTIPQFVMDLPKVLLQKVLEGYIDSSDTNDTSLMVQKSTVSKRLVLQLQEAFAKAYCVYAKVQYLKRPPCHTVCGRTVNQHNTYWVICKKTQKYTTYKVIDDMLWIPVRKLQEEHMATTVYNMQVAEDNSYTANNFAVHNCQDLSIAGKRAGLSGERSGLFMEQVRLIREMREYEKASGRTGESVRPRFMVWENVLGALSSNKGEDFRVVLEETAKIADETASIPRPPKDKWTNSGCIMGDGWSIAWRIFDAQFWGVPQRRRRIALVADFGGQCAPDILFERESMSRDSAEGGKEGQGPSGGIETGAYSSGARDGAETFCIAGNIIGRSLQAGGNGPGFQENISYTLTSADCHAICQTNLDKQKPVAFHLTQDPVSSVERTPCLSAGNSQNGQATIGVVTDENADSVIAFVQNQRNEVRDLHDIAGALAAQAGVKQQTYVCVSKPAAEFPMDTTCSTEQAVSDTVAFKGGQGAKANRLGIQEEVFPTLTGTASGTNQVPVVCIPINDKATRFKGGGPTSNEDGVANGLGVGKDGDPMYTLTVADKHAVAVHQNASGECRIGTVANTLNTNANASGRNAPLVAEIKELRCLCPEENRKRTEGNIENSSYPAVAECSAGFKYKAAASAGNIGYEVEIAPTLIAGQTSGVLQVCDCLYPEVAGTLCASGAGTDRPAGQGNEDSFCIVQNVVNSGIKNLTPGENQTNRIYDPSGVFPALCSREKSGTNRQAVLCNAQAVDCRNLRATEMCGTLQSKENGGYSLNFINPVLCMAHSMPHAEICEEFSPTLTCHHEQPFVNSATVVRRLTPRECERLQGYPDNWTKLEPIEDMSDAEYDFWCEVLFEKSKREGTIILGDDGNWHRRKYITSKHKGFDSTRSADENGGYWEETKSLYTPMSKQKMVKWYNRSFCEKMDSARYKVLGNSIALPSWKWVLERLCACYDYDPTMGSLFDGISGFPLIWSKIVGEEKVLWTSEIEEFPIAVCRRHFEGV